jgi:hypothetical protein
MGETKIWETDCTYIIDPVFEVVVLSVCTDKTPGLVNLIVTLERLGYTYKIIGLGEKWEGWIWRTKRYIQELEKIKDEKIVILCDGSDVIFTEPPSETIKRFREMDVPVLMGAERNTSTGKFKYDFILRRKIWEEYKRREPISGYRFPNAGVIIGYKTPLLSLLEQNKEAVDDQAGFILMGFEHENWFKLDTNTYIVGNVVQGMPMFESEIEIDEKTVWTIEEPIRGKFRLLNKQTHNRPCILHFAGGNWGMYNEIGKVFIGQIHQHVNIGDDNKALRYIVGKNWSQNLVWTVPSFFRAKT